MAADETAALKGLCVRPSFLIANETEAAILVARQLGRVPKHFSDGHDYAREQHEMTKDMSHMITREAAVVYTTHRTTTNVIGGQAHLFAAAVVDVGAIAMPVDVHSQHVASKTSG